MLFVHRSSVSSQSDTCSPRAFFFLQCQDGSGSVLAMPQTVYFFVPLSLWKGRSLRFSHGGIAPHHAIFTALHSCIYDPKSGTLKQLPTNIKLSFAKSTRGLKGEIHVDEISNAKRKGKSVSGKQPAEEILEALNDCCVSTLDIFSGCGGFLEGLEKSGAIWVSSRSQL